MVADDHIGATKTFWPQNAIVADTGVLHDVAEMPDAGAFSNLTGLVDNSRLVHKKFAI